MTTNQMQTLRSKAGKTLRTAVVTHARDASFMGALCGRDLSGQEFPIHQLTMYVDAQNRSIEFNCPHCLAKK